jgi:hypothetical protein
LSVTKAEIDEAVEMFDDALTVSEQGHEPELMGTQNEVHNIAS